MNPIRENEHQAGGADDDSQREPLQQRVDTNLLDGFLVEARADKKKCHRESDSAETAECYECRAENWRRGIE